MRTMTMVATLGMLAFAGLAIAGSKKDDKIPVTTSSEEARSIYLKGRDLVEKLRVTDGRAQYQAALAKDPTFALAAVGLANTSGTAKEFWEGVNLASAQRDKVSDGERLIIDALVAGAKGETAAQRAALTKLTRSYPNDERAHNALGLFHFGQQDWKAAISEMEKAAKIDAQYSSPYNYLGYAYRFLDDYAGAEKAFKKYIELIPGDPNGYDSYAELLYKMGKHDESIAQYDKALSVDANILNAYIGIGNNQMVQGKLDAARASFAKIGTLARTTGEKRTSNFWMSQSYVFEGQTDKALAEMQKNLDLGAAAGDQATVAGDHAAMGEILLGADRADEALVHFKAQAESIDKADVPAEVKETTHRNQHFDAGRVATVKGDLATAKAELAAYAKLVAVKKNTFELFAQHELAGQIAIAEKKYPQAIAELGKANPRDPRAIYLLGVAYQGKGDAAKAKATLTKAAEFNEFANNFALIRKRAKDALAKS